MDEFGFIKQLRILPFEYTDSYTAKQGTTPRMARLRIAWVQDNLKIDLKNSKILEVGPGAGILLRELRKICKHVDGYDVCKTKCVNVSLEEALGTHYDMVFFCDVVEHFQDINHIFDFHFNHAYFSFPWTPDVIPDNYRHAKANEHIYHLSPEPFEKFCLLHNYKTVAISNFEDTIRTPWSLCLPNICSIGVSLL